MSKRKEFPERIIILQDVGCNMNQPGSGTDTAFQISKTCVMQILLRKLFSKSTDEFALITFGDSETYNRLSAGGQYQSINVQSLHFSVVNRDILNCVEKFKVNENGKGDWLDAIVVALNFISEENEPHNRLQHKIVLFSNFQGSVFDDQVDIITRKFKEMAVELTVIGIDTNKQRNNNEQNKEMNEIALISSMVEELQGTVCSFQEAFSELVHLQRKVTKPTPWNAMLTISSKIKIPIRAFKKIADVKPFKWTFGTLDNENVAVEKEKAYVRYDEENEMDIHVEREELINAYQFGTTIVPFSDIDKESMTYKSGLRGLYLIGCTLRNTVPRHMLVGDGSYIVMARQDDEVGNKILQCFVQAMFQDNIVGIARRVYRDDSAAHLGVLYPKVTDDGRYFVYVELPFAEDEHIFKFPTLSNVQVTEEEKEAMEDLIDSMDFDRVDSEAEMFDLTRMYDPHEQYTLRCLGHKYMHSNDPIPEEVMQDMINVMKPLPLFEKVSKNVIETVKNVFKLKKEEKSLIFRKFNEALKENSANETKPSELFHLSSEVAQVSTSKLFSLKEESCHESIEKILRTTKQLHNNGPNIDELVVMLKKLRRSCNFNPKLYNNFITNLKNDIEANRPLMWDRVVNENLGLITQQECSSSDVSINVAAEFLKISEKETDSVYGSMKFEDCDDSWLDDL